MIRRKFAKQILAAMISGFIPTKLISNISQLFPFNLRSLDNIEDKTIIVVMRDGVRLKTRIWKPSGAWPWPVVLSRGYGTGFAGNKSTFLDAGYVCIGQECRGNGGSQGSRFLSDKKDGYDTIWKRCQTCESC